jgi:uncharacterized RmlC-like cupin family protein
MQQPSNRLAASVVLALVAAAAIFWQYLPEVRHAYWDLMTPDRGPEAHGSTILRVIPQGTPYDRWLEEIRAQIPVFDGLFIQDVATVGLRPWLQMGEGVKGLYLRFADYQITDGRILELPARGRAGPQRHLFEMGIYFLGGPGHTVFFRDGNEPLRVDWRAGSLLSVPLNVRYQHFNDGDQPVRLLAVTSFPFALNASASESFVFENDFDFADRFDASSQYFQTSVPFGEKRVATNFVPDAGAVALMENDDRGSGTTTLRWAMAGNSVIDLHVSAIPPGRYMKAHRHSSDAFVLILGGEGYSLIWSGDDMANRTRIDWQKGTLFVPPTYWYHQHLNVGTEPSRQLAINAPPLVRNLGLRFSDQIEVESPAIRAEWEKEVRARQVPH